jgi:hypothetical protein
VADESNALPNERAPNPTSIGGRGLILVAAMSRTWGVRDRDGGKTVWADVAVPGAITPEKRALTSA